MGEGGMMQILLIAAPTALVSIALEIREGRLAALPGTLDGGIVIGLTAIMARTSGII